MVLHRRGSPGRRMEGTETVTVSDLDIYRAANVLIEQHGADAPVEAAMRVDAMLEAGDLDGRAVWRRILAAVEELMRTEPAARDRVH